jgi:hypothetical protein
VEQSLWERLQPRFEESRLKSLLRAEQRAEVDLDAFERADGDRLENVTLRAAARDSNLSRSSRFAEFDGCGAAAHGEVNPTPGYFPACGL